MGRLPMLTMTPRGDSKQIGSFGGLNKGLAVSYTHLTLPTTERV